jgi:hypothetical protein
VVREVGRDTGFLGANTLARGRVGHGRRATRRFQLACVRLAWSGPTDGRTWPLDALAAVPATTRESEAARALIDLADCGDDLALRRLLRPDPASESASWTVACYRIGDLAPHSLRDFTDPIEAVTTLAECDDAGHLAAELVASSAEGLCWVALVRTGDQVRFQLLGEHSVLERPGRHALSGDEREALATATAHWASSIASWYTQQGSNGLAPQIPPMEQAADAQVSAARRSEPQPLDAPLARSSEEEALDDVAMTLSDLVEAVSGIAAAVERLERELGTLAARMDAVVPAPASVAVPSSPVARVVGAHANPVVPAPPGSFGEPAHRWWPSRQRAERPHPAVGGTAAEPL